MRFTEFPAHQQTLRTLKDMGRLGLLLQKLIIQKKEHEMSTLAICGLLTFTKATSCLSFVRKITAELHYRIE